MSARVWTLGPLRYRGGVPPSQAVAPSSYQTLGPSAGDARASASMSALLMLSSTAVSPWRACTPEGRTDGRTDMSQG